MTSYRDVARAMGPEVPLEDPVSRPRRWLRKARRNVRRLLLIFAVAYVGMFVYHQRKALPEGVHVAGTPHELVESQVRFLHDLTFERGGSVVLEQEIFDRVFALIDGAQQFVVIDMFLFNDFAGVAGDGYQALSHALTERLVARKRERPELAVLFITDPINRHYGGAPSPPLDELAAAGVEVVISDLDRLRDSNPVWSSLWRLCCRWLGNSETGGWLGSPFDPTQKVTLRTYLELINFKANHRKVLVVDDGDGELVALVTSANPHDASSRHSNVAFEVSGAPAGDLLASELAVARWSGWQGQLPALALPQPSPEPTASGEPEGTVAVRVVSEAAVREALVGRLVTATPDHQVDVAMFYLSDRDVIEELIATAQRGSRVRLILDANRDAFGREKGGVPNRPVARELVERSGGRIEVRWYRTHGEQFHTKMTIVRSWDGVAVSLGSSNLTRRNIGDYNLEANLEIVATPSSALEREITDYFERLWSNAGDSVYTDDFEVFEDRSRVRHWLYRFQEWSGLSTF